jgi:hypothetical protein
MGMIPVCRCGLLYLIFRQMLGLVLLMGEDQLGASKPGRWIQVELAARQ